MILHKFFHNCYEHHQFLFHVIKSSQGCYIMPHAHPKKNVILSSEIDYIEIYLISSSFLDHKKCHFTKIGSIYDKHNLKVCNTRISLLHIFEFFMTNMLEHLIWFFFIRFSQLHNIYFVLRKWNFSLWMRPLFIDFQYNATKMLNLNCDWAIYHLGPGDFLQISP